jgi:hypothetical protein
MAYARDGKHFPSELQARKYDQSLAERGESEFDNAPSGDPVKEGAKHGAVRDAEYHFLGNGQHQVRVTHIDGHKWEQVHPEAFRAHDMITKAHGFDEQPPAIKTHMRSRSQPVGPKENERLAKEDKRAPEEFEEEETE